MTEKPLVFDTSELVANGEGQWVLDHNLGMEVPQVALFDENDEPLGFTSLSINEDTIAIPVHEAAKRIEIRRPA